MSILSPGQSRASFTASPTDAPAIDWHGLWLRALAPRLTAADIAALDFVYVPLPLQPFDLAERRQLHTDVRRFLGLQGGAK